MSGSIEIRRLGAGDWKMAEALNGMFAAAFDDHQSYAASPPDPAYLDRLLGKSDTYALVAIAGGSIVGGLVGYRLEKFEQRRSEIYIYDLAVAADWRRRGIATALIDELRALARDDGAWVIFVQADHGDDPAVALYTRLGVREDVMHFDIAPSGE